MKIQRMGRVMLVIKKRHSIFVKLINYYIRT